MQISEEYRPYTWDERIDILIRFFLYTIIFWLPYSSAVIETCVIISLILWIVKRWLLVRKEEIKDLSSKEKGCFLLKAFRPKATFLDRPIFWFIIICILSNIKVNLFLHSLHGLFTKTLEWFVIYYLVVEVFNKKKHFYAALCVFLVTASAVILDSFLQYFITGKDIFFGNEVARGGATAGFSHPNGLGAYLAVAIHIFLAWFVVSIKDAKWQMKLLSLGVLIAGVVSLIITVSRGAILAMVVGLLMFLFLIKKRLFFGGLVVIASGLLIFYLSSTEEIKTKARMDLTKITNTLAWRSDIWKDSFSMIKERPILGRGLNTFMREFQWYRRRYHQYNPTYAHNCYIQMLAEVGAAGLTVFLWMMFRLFNISIKTIRGSEISVHQFKFFLIGLVSGTLAFLAHSAVDVNLYSLKFSTYFWLMVGLIVSICKLFENPKEGLT